jgi:hypothetical protein
MLDGQRSGAGRNRSGRRTGFDTDQLVNIRMSASVELVAD